MFYISLNKPHPKRNKMAKVNLKKMSKSELDALEAELATAKREREESDIQAAREKVLNLLEKEGYTFADVFGRGTGRKTGPVKPKYRNPKNPSETWTGRGRRPRWLEAELKKGKSVNSFLIK